MTGTDRSRNRALPLLGRAAVTIGLVALLVWKVDWREALRTLADVSPAGIVALLAVSFLLTVVSCLKWRLFLRERVPDVSLWALVKLYLVGYFFNNFAPSTLGGDVARGYALGRSTRQSADAFASVFLERFTGFMALLGMGALAAAVNPALAAQPGLVFCVVVMAAGFAGMAAFLLCPPLQRMVAGVVGGEGGKGWRGPLRRFLDAVFWFRNHPRLLGRAMLLSVLFHLLTIVNVMIACLALHVPFRWLDLALLVPLVLLVSAIPISLNAIGLMEGSFVWFFGLAGIGAPAALSVALILRAKNLLLGLVGGGMLLWRGNQR